MKIARGQADRARSRLGPAYGLNAGGLCRWRLGFPDWKASIARLLVRSLIPQAVLPGTAEDIVTERIDSGWLESAG